MYDARLFRLRLEDRQRIALATLDGRIEVTLRLGDYGRRLLTRAAKIGEADLLYQPECNRWRLALGITLPDIVPIDPSGVLGVDLGIKNIAADSDGTLYSGAHVNGLRRRYHRLRQRLQAKGTRSATRRLRSQKGRQRRFQVDVNHCVSKQIVARAATTNRAISLEDLNGIRSRVKASRDQRRVLHGWSFRQLRAFITYKAVAAGITVVAVDPKNSSRTCPVCGLIEASSRRSQAVFECVRCGFAGHADHIAAMILAERGRAALVNQPNASHPPPSAGAGASPRLNARDS